MTLNASKIKSKGFTPADPLEAGVYPARIVNIIDLGVQKNFYMGEEKEPSQRVMVTYELLDEFMKDEDGNDDVEKPRWLSEDFALYSLDSDRAKSTKRYYGIDPKCEHGGDWTQLIGFPVMVTVVCNRKEKNGKEVVYNNVAGVAAMRDKEAKKAPELVGEPKVFEFHNNPDLDVFLSLPNFVQDRIKDSADFSGSVLESLLESHGEKSEGEGAKKEEAPKKPAQKVSEETDENEDW